MTAHNSMLLYLLLKRQSLHGCVAPDGRKADVSAGENIVTVGEEDVETKNQSDVGVGGSGRRGNCGVPKLHGLGSERNVE